jgi:hypothetical protein
MQLPGGGQPVKSGQPDVEDGEIRAGPQRGVHDVVAPVELGDDPACPVRGSAVL